MLVLNHIQHPQEDSGLNYGAMQLLLPFFCCCVGCTLIVLNPPIAHSNAVGMLALI